MNNRGRLKNQLYDCLVQINLFVRHHDLREHWEKKKNGAYPDQRFFCISYEDKHAGLFGIVDRVLGACSYAEERGLIPIVALEEGKIQYKNEAGSETPWEVFYQPVAEYKMQDLRSASKVLFMGYNSRCPRFIRDEVFKNAETLHEASEYMKKRARLSKEAVKRLKAEQNRLDLSNSLGVFLRGTDYAALKPYNHSIQPTVEQAIPYIDSYLAEHPNTDYIYLVTEDEAIFHCLLKRYGERIKMTGGRFVHAYDGRGLLADYIEDVNEQGFEYLVRIYMLSTCRALIGGSAAGASFARIINDNHYEQVFIFDLGRYK